MWNIDVLDTEDGGTTVLGYFRHCSPNITAQHPEKTSIFNNTAVRTSNLTQYACYLMYLHYSSGLKLRVHRPNGLF